MAAPPFFDINDLDLGAVALDGDEVGRLNPQSGDMRHLDHVVWFNEDITLALGVKQVRDDEFWVPGHIPGRPLFPGVLMIEAAAQLASLLYRRKCDESRFLGFTRCDNTVFRGQVQPGDTFYILGREIEFRPRRFKSEAQGMVDGNIVFETQITGMVM